MDAVVDKDVAWPGVEKLTTVQDILDRNKFLIREINANQETRTSESLDRNSSLISELNTNIQKVSELYNELAQSFLDSNFPDLQPQ